MKYKIKWTLRSALETLLHSDTIFGHLCWAVSYEFGEKRLQEFLEAMEKPALLLSSAFPQGTLPVPDMVPPYDPLPDDLAGALLKRRTMKSAKDLRFLPLEQWHARQGDYVHAKVIEQTDAIMAQLNELCRKMEQEMVMHNSINRITGTTVRDAASLYSEPAWFAENDTVFDSYLQTDYFTQAELEQLFGFVANSGFGRNKHTGRGRFDIQLMDCDLKEIADPNAWLLLSNMVPAPDDPLHAGYRGFIKYGKLGGSYASAQRSPYKKPLFLFEPGSVFWGTKPPIGSLVRNIHPDDPAICQHAYAMCVGFHVPGGEHAG